MGNENTALLERAQRRAAHASRRVRWCISLPSPHPQHTLTQPPLPPSRDSSLFGLHLVSALKI